MRRPEQEIQKAVVQHLRARAEPKVFFWHTPNEGKRGFVNAAALKAIGLTAGVPDLLILKAGSLYALELKAAKGTLTPSQRLVLARMENCGAETAVAHSLDEALVTLEYWGVLKRSVSNRVIDTPTESANDRDRTQLEGTDQINYRASRTIGGGKEDYRR